MKTKPRTKKYRPAGRVLVLDDRRIEDACKLRGKDPHDLTQILGVIRSTWRGMLWRYTRFQSPLGGYFGKWEIVV